LDEIKESLLCKVNPLRLTKAKCLLLRAIMAALQENTKESRKKKLDTLIRRHLNSGHPKEQAFDVEHVRFSVEPIRMHTVAHVPK
jgi:predicted glycosyltransferase